MIKFRTGGFGKNLIEDIEVERETEKSVWVNGSRVIKHGSPLIYWDTWIEAHSFLLKRAARELESARRSFEVAQEGYRNIEGMKAPPEKEKK